nr:hypothetical protein [Planctomycetota bacterium]
MPALQSDAAIVRLQTVACALGLCVALIGIGVLVGWAFDIAWLKTVLPGLVTMKPNAAAGFVAGGFALVLLARPRRLPARLLGGFCAGICLAIGAGTLAQYLFGVDLGIDELLFREPPQAFASLAPTRMHPTSAFAFLLSGSALCRLVGGRVHGSRLAQGTMLVVLTIALITLLGYLYGVREFHGLARYGQMALHTTVGFTVLSIGLLCARPDVGMMPAIVGAGAGSRIARPLLLGATIVPIVVGAVVMHNLRHGAYGQEFALAIQVALTVACFLPIICLVAVVLNRSDAARLASERDLREAHADLERRVVERTAELSASVESLRVAKEGAEAATQAKSAF